MNHRAIKIVLFLGLCFVLLVAWHYFSIYKYSATPIVIETTDHKPIIFNVNPGVSIPALANQLYQQNIIKDPKKFIQLANFKKADKHIQAGEYSIMSGITPEQLLSKFIRGDIVLHRLTIIEGWTFKQLIQAVSANPAVAHSLTDSSAHAVMNTLGHPNQNPEGLFYPDTYLFKRDTKDITLLRMSYQHMQKKLNAAWKKRDPTIPYKNAYQALIAASLIEKESKLSTERPLVSRVILNRLQKKMLLQIDASVIYGLGDLYNGKLTRIALNMDTPYNTYLNHGLPPTPIAMPSIDAINAALHPSKTKALYYVAKGDGGHVFSETLQGHQKAIHHYLLPRKLAQSLSRPIVRNSISLSLPLVIHFWLNWFPKQSAQMCRIL